MRFGDEEFNNSARRFMSEIHELSKSYSAEVVASGLGGFVANLLVSQDDPVSSADEFFQMVKIYAQQIGINGLKKLKMDQNLDDEEIDTGNDGKMHSTSS